LGLYYWEKLEQESQKFLMTAEYYYEVAENSKSQILDFSPSVVEYSKTIELEIERKVLLPFKSWAVAKIDTKKYGIKTMLAYDLKDRELQKLASFLTKPRPKPLELGSFAFVNDVISHRLTGGKNSVLVDWFDDFLSQFKNQSFFLSSAWLKGLKLLASNYRNPAAHTEYLSFNIVSACREFLLEKGFLREFLHAAEPRQKQTSIAGRTINSQRE
jgi:hypothetical protein